MASYKEIQDHVRSTHGTVVQTCWIADVKEQLGLPKRIATNRQGMDRLKPCPPAKRQMIVDAMRELGMIVQP